MTAPATGTIAAFASAPFGVSATLLNPNALSPKGSDVAVYSQAFFGVFADIPFTDTTPKGADIATYASAPFGVGATAGGIPSATVDHISGEIVVTTPPLFGVMLEQQPRGVLADQVGGWLPEHHEQEAKRRKKWKKIQEKRERRQEYVMRKIWNELKGIDLADDPELQALMAEFETPEEIYQSAADIQAVLNEAYMKYVVEKQIRIGKQDQEDEEAIMLSLMSML